jgi:hypothetical protein
VDVDGRENVVGGSLGRDFDGTEYFLMETSRVLCEMRLAAWMLGKGRIK